MPLFNCIILPIELGLPGRPFDLLLPLCAIDSRRLAPRITVIRPAPLCLIGGGVANETRENVSTEGRKETDDLREYIDVFETRRANKW